MSYFQELHIYSSAEQLETILQAFTELGALSITTEDANADTLDEVPLYGEPDMPSMPIWEQTLVKILFDETADIPDMLNLIKEELNLELQGQIHKIDDQNWVALTQAQFEPINIGKHVLITPTWHYQTEQAYTQTAVLQLDPGMAFGTGSHPTTHLCGQYLSAYYDSYLNTDPLKTQTNVEHFPNQILKNAKVLDYGCGSGILAMIASKLGCKQAIGVDIDEQAVLATKQNAAFNQLNIQAMTSNEDLSRYYGTFDLVLANILSNPLKLLAPMLPKFLNTGACLVLSGILDRQTQELIDVYAPYLELEVFGIQDGWVCLVGKK